MSDIRYEESGNICSHSEYISELENGIEQLEKENKILRECVEFYADKSTYLWDEFAFELMPSSDLDEIQVGKYIDRYAGKKARETLKKLGEK